ncbi:hypothetical protein AAFF_G00347710 [Aldrovandia affinis]|uniref:Uncharacterized protein n=1 Tax=Aldrovandia affinis TaxID=143900 RepID=A0AAD7WP70_9TELE|nr:hypothetical protein AAFF_G00347710 [Aldrovandia affinis]
MAMAGAGVGHQGSSPMGSNQGQAHPNTCITLHHPPPAPGLGDQSQRSCADAFRTGDASSVFIPPHRVPPLPGSGPCATQRESERVSEARPSGAARDAAAVPLEIPRGDSPLDARDGDRCANCAPRPKH